MADHDRDLMRRLRAGDRTALEPLYRRHVERLWRFAYARLRDREAASDVVQDTFVRVCRSAGTYAGRAQVATWLFAIARSALVDHVRKRRRHEMPGEPRVLKLVPAAAEPDPLERDEARIRVHAALATLRPAQRDALVLCELCELKIAEAAAALGWSESRVKVTVHRARKKLAERLREQEETVTEEKGIMGLRD
ncbi:MAG: RNA polymerase sigma factor [Phycisphaerales bacterium]|nr:RNA polymerase sigma factor [Phycisphaerales bacterium]